jgi:hypothetical protein
MDILQNTKAPVDIVSMITTNPIIKLDDTYKSKLVSKIKENFTPEQQKMYLTSLYCTINYSQTKDFIINFDDVWRWVGFDRKDHAKRLLEKNFQEDVDFKIGFAPPKRGAKNKSQNETENRGGHNEETIMLNIRTFKKFCLKARTKQADEIHDYYVRLEEIVNETVKEEAEEMRKQIQLKDKIIKEKDQEIEQKDEDIQTVLNDTEKTIVKNHDNQRLVYLAYINEENDIKFGKTYNIRHRIMKHKNENNGIGGQFTLIRVFPSDKYEELERRLMKHPRINKHLIRECENQQDGTKNLLGRMINGQRQTELIKLTKDFSLNTLEKIIYELDAELKYDTKMESERVGRENRELKEQVKIQGSIIDKVVEDELMKNKVHIQRDIITGEEKTIRSFDKMKSVRKNYLNQPKQHFGKIYYTRGDSYWKPPPNFRYVPEQKPSAHMKMCKSVHKITNEVTYYNSLVEAAKIIGLVKDSDTSKERATKSRKLKHVADKQTPTNDPFISPYMWYKIESCGSWVCSDTGVEKKIEELVIYSSETSREEVVYKPGTTDIIKDLFQITSDENDKLRYIDIDAVLRKYKVQTTAKMIKQKLIGWGAVPTQPNKKIKMVGIAKMATGMYKIKIKNQKDLAMIV